jgi:hypothetical protein
MSSDAHERDAYVLSRVLPNPPCLNETLGARTYGCFTSLNETQVASRIDEQRLSLASEQQRRCRYGV